MKVKISLLLFILTVFIAGCMPNEQSDSLVIATSFYVTEDIVSYVVNDSAEVELIIPKSADPHSYEPTVRQIARLENADSFVILGGSLFESIEDSIISSNPHLKIIDSTHDVNFIEGGHSHDEHSSDEHSHDEHSSDDHSHDEHSHDEHSSDEHSSDEHSHDEHSHDEHSHDEHSHDEHSNDEHNHGEFDPHVWLSPSNVKIMTQKIVDELSEIYPEQAENYQQRGEEYILKLEELQQNYEEILSSCEHNMIIVNHKAFGYLTYEFGFEQISVAGFSPEIEPTPNTVARVIETAQEYNIEHVFSEGQFDSHMADTIANDLNGEVLELNPLMQQRHNSYFDVMNENLEQLAIGMNCN